MTTIIKLLGGPPGPRGESPIAPLALTSVPTSLRLETNFAGVNNDIVCVSDVITRLDIVASPSPTSTVDSSSYVNGVITVIVGSPGGNVAGTMSAQLLLDWLNATTIPSAFSSFEIAGHESSGVGNVVAGSYPFTITPVPAAVGQSAIVTHDDYSKTEWVAVSLTKWLPRTAGIILHANGDWYRQTLAADGTAEYELLPNQ